MLRDWCDSIFGQAILSFSYNGETMDRDQGIARVTLAEQFAYLLFSVIASQPGRRG